MTLNEKLGCLDKLDMFTNTEFSDLSDDDYHDIMNEKPVVEVPSPIVDRQGLWKSSHSSNAGLM